MNGSDLTTSGIFNPTLRMSSLEIAELMEKNHQHVMRDIRELIEQGAIDQSRYGQISYLDSMNREQPLYQLDFESTMLLITGYDANRRAKVINRWVQLERGEAVPAAAGQQSGQDRIITTQDEIIRLHRKCEALQDEKIALLEARKKKRVNRPVTEEEKQEIVAMVASGMSQSEVAKKMRRSSATVSYLVSERLRAAGVAPIPPDGDDSQMELFSVSVLGGGEA